MPRGFLKLAAVIALLHLVLFIPVAICSFSLEWSSAMQRTCDYIAEGLAYPILISWVEFGPEKLERLHFDSATFALELIFLLLNSAVWGCAVAWAVISKKKTVRLTVAVAILLIALKVWNPFPVHYKGDGSFADHGRFSYPRYVITFPDLPLFATGERRFMLRGLPTETMGLMLYLPNRPTPSEADSLMHSKVAIEATLVDSSGKELCHVSGSPDGNDLNKKWNLQIGPDSAAYFHVRCSKVNVRSWRDYALAIRVVDAPSDIEHITVIPKFEGGGEQND
jgi:hypothetical protein